MKKAIFIQCIFCISLLTAGNVSADQSENAKSVYRVTAYKKGDNKVVSVSNTVEIIPALSIYIPNAFTPNNDGLNDTFGVIGEGITEYHMQIFNRWGNLIFESKNANDQWDGTYLGETVQQEMYTYTVVIKGEKRVRINKAGSVLVIR